MFPIELAEVIDLHHTLVLLAGRIDWASFEREFSAPSSETTGALAKPVQLMVGLHHLKHVHNLSDEITVAQWVENPYQQYFCGMKYFEHAPPIDPSSMTRWRKMIGEKGAEALLAQTTASGLETGAIRRSSFAKFNVDTTVQEKAVAFPTDARLYDDRMRRKLVRLAEGAEIKLRPTRS